MAHRMAKLTPFGRLLICERVLELGWTVAETAKAAGVSRATCYKWLRRFREEGPAGLEERSSRPRRCPHGLAPRAQREILRARRRSKRGPHWLAAELGRPRSTIYGVLRRYGVSRLSHVDRPTGIPVRYERARAGELLHLDVKKLGRIPPGGGHRMLGRRRETEAWKKRHRLGYDYLHVAVDDHPRVAFVRVFSDEQGQTAARFLLEAAGFFADHGVRIERVLTDRHNSYRLSRSFQEAVQWIGARHKLTRGYRPQTNGKAERFIRTMLAEWAYVRLYRSNAERLKALPAWIDFYNSVRPHTALGDRPPMSRLSTT